MAANKVLIVYSSKTGNTRKVAEGVHAGLTARGIEARIAPVEEAPAPAGGLAAAAYAADGAAAASPAGASAAAGGEIILLGFWVDKGVPDKKALKYLKALTGRKIGLFGTLGAYPDSEHAKDCARKVEAIAAKKNTCLGVFLCQGKIDPKLTEMFSKIPKGLPHHMDEERRKRHEEAAKHPDGADIARALEACAEMAAKGQASA